MSNQSVGSVYQQIIREVVESSRVDFEEGGVDESVLDELARVSLLLFVFLQNTIRNPVSTSSRAIKCDTHKWASIGVVVGGVEVICCCGVGHLGPSLAVAGGRRNQRVGGDPSVYGRFYADADTCPRFD